MITFLMHLTVRRTLELENKDNLRHLPRFPDFFVTFRILSPATTRAREDLSSGRPEKRFLPDKSSIISCDRMLGLPFPANGLTAGMGMKGAQSVAGKGTGLEVTAW